MQQVVVTDWQKLVISSERGMLEFVDEQGRVIGQYLRCGSFSPEPGSEWDVSEEELNRLRNQEFISHEELMTKVRSYLP